MILARALVCDHPGCKRRILGDGGPRSYRSKWLRRQGLKEGWMRTEGGGDLCPDHTATRPPETGEDEVLDEVGDRRVGRWP